MIKRFVCILGVFAAVLLLAASSAPPIRRHKLLEESGVSAYAFQAAANFLSNFTSIFTGIDPAEFDRECIESVDFELIDAMPWIYARRWLDEYTEQVIWAQFYYAASFGLYDFDGDGIPEILVHFNIISPTESYVAFSHLYKYSDGEYRQIEVRGFANGEETWTHLTVAHDFFWDEDGRLITFVWLPEPHQWVQYDELVIGDKYAELHLVLAMPFDDERQWEAWREHHWYEWVFPYYGGWYRDSWIYHNPTIFGTDIALTLIRPFAELGDELIFMVEGD